MVLTGGYGIRYCIRQWIISQCTNALLALCSPASPATSTSSWRATVAPESVAKLKYQIAYLNFSNGNLSEADSNCRDVLESQALQDALDRDLDIGDVWVATGGSNRARKLLHFVQSYFKSVTVSTGGGDNDEDRISISSSIGKCLVAEQDYERAAAVYTELVHMSTSAWGQFHKTTTEYTLALASVCVKLRRLEEAEKWYRTVYDHAVSRMGAGSAEAMEIAHTMAQVLADATKFEESEKVYQGLYDRCIERFGPFHYNTLEMLKMYCVALCNMNKSAETERLYRGVINGLTAKYGATGVETLVEICNFASVMAFQNNFSTAEALYRRALTGFESKFSQSQPDGTIVTGRTADTGGGVGHSAPELRASGSSKDVVRGSAGGSGGREVQWEQYMVGCLGSLADMLLRQEKSEEAMNIIHQDIKIRTERMNARKQRLQEAQQELQRTQTLSPSQSPVVNEPILARLESGSYSTNKPVTLSTVRELETTISTMCSELLQKMIKLANLLEYSNRQFDAEMLLRDALQKAETNLGLECYDTATVTYKL
eukprot:gene571-617_t